MTIEAHSTRDWTVSPFATFSTGNAVSVCYVSSEQVDRNGSPHEFGCFQGRPSRQAAVWFFSGRLVCFIPLIAGTARRCLDT